MDWVPDCVEIPNVTELEAQVGMRTRLSATCRLFDLQIANFSGACPRPPESFVGKVRFGGIPRYSSSEHLHLSFAAQKTSGALFPLGRTSWLAAPR